MTTTREGSKEDCENFLEEIKGMGYVIESYILAPVQDHWMITVTYRDEDKDFTLDK